ncbi:MAG: hypothetical protein MPI95_00980 [Nitrosopumilus sp.]|nr:hypothetical protein [Nitrosopumilus sp.]CAI9832108.1 conserved hypothetical protein [Nitrosopumilaceae archaeon]MDA7941394.1 hypothetical protein [Nitrosopumilus sp.]MDA7942802.1 hypothetical protein [Nitrosopumilus sp.]MDA7945088.1 hypothetical protein [Nitrosopumilus sp.]
MPDAKDTLPRYVQLGSPLEFSRLVCALEHPPRVSFMHEHEGRKVLSVQMDVLSKKPIVYYVPHDDGGDYICYGMRSGREESQVVRSATDPSMLYSPIIRIKSLPSGLRPGNGTADRYQPIELEDVSSLAKLSWGMEETAFPLFLFPRGGSWLLGAFLNFAEDGPSYFCHVSLGEDPGRPFVRFSPAEGSEPEFVDGPSGHGYTYLKIIRIMGTHPLVGDGGVPV